jgi:hypothetical protein
LTKNQRYNAKLAICSRFNEISELKDQSFKEKETHPPSASKKSS